MTEAFFGLLGVVLGAVLSGVVMWSVARRDRAHSEQVARADRKQRHVAARTDQWWVRTQWALDLVMAGAARERLVGLEVLKILGSSGWSDVRELDIIGVAVDAVIDPLDSGPGLGESEAAEGDHGYG